MNNPITDHHLVALLYTEHGDITAWRTVRTVNIVSKLAKCVKLEKEASQRRAAQVTPAKLLKPFDPHQFLLKVGRHTRFPKSVRHVVSWNSECN